MLTRGIVACAAVAALSTAAAAADLPAAPAGLVSDFASAGEAPVDLADRPGFRLSKSFRLRLDISDRFAAVTRGAGPERTMLIDRSRQRRIASMLDYYPIGGSGFRLSAGMRKLPRPAARVAGLTNASAFELGGIGNTTALGARSNIAKRSPTMMAGWTGMIAKEMQFGISAGVAEEHGRQIALGGALPATSRGTARWSRIGQVAQVNLAMRF